MRASNSHYVLVPTTIQAGRFNYYATVGNDFPILQSTADIQDGDNALFQIGLDVSRVWLSLPARQTQFIQLRVTVGGTDLTQYLIQDVQIQWPDESGGSGSLKLVAQNPFANDALVDCDVQINITATLKDPSTGEEVTVQLFKGKIVQWDYNPDTDEVDVSFQDMSRDVSHDTSRINREILAVDPVRTEKITCTVANKLTVSQIIDLDQPTPILGIWAESDTGLQTNITDQGDFIITSGDKTISFFHQGLINVGTNYLIRYLIPLSQFSIPQLTKSAVVQMIADIAGITSVRLERAGYSEDEIVGVNITANNELPLDLIRKIVVPQTWKVEYNEAGDLVVRREILKTTSEADFSLDEDTILDGSLNITKDIDSVVNEIRVAGILKRLGTDSSKGHF